MQIVCVFEEFPIFVLCIL